MGRIERYQRAMIFNEKDKIKKAKLLAEHTTYDIYYWLQFNLEQLDKQIKFNVEKEMKKQFGIKKNDQLNYIIFSKYKSKKGKDIERNIAFFPTLEKAILFLFDLKIIG